ncbi:hypothetical protein [Winogradskyella sp. MIT101101]|uniref:hypothetical protein n=1 Tax=Winogradskyella sp. MIT101101 TaxID=3098297 RepID=UPI003999D1C5
MNIQISKVKGLLFVLLGFLFISTINHSTANIDKSDSNYVNAIITVSYLDGELVLSDNQGNPYDANNPEEFTTYVTPNGSVSWQAGQNIESISITIDSGAHIFEKLPEDIGNGNWFGVMENIDTGDAKYSIIYRTKFSNEIIVLDPKIRMKADGN